MDERTRNFLAELALLPVRARALGLYVTANRLDNAVKMAGFESVGEVDRCLQYEKSQVDAENRARKS